MANLPYKTYFIKKINRKSNCYGFVKLHDTDGGIRTCALDPFDKRPDVDIGGNRGGKVILMVGDDHVISKLPPFVVWVYS